jgi:hypothetical protein
MKVLKLGSYISLVTSLGWGRHAEMYTEFWWGNFFETGHLKHREGNRKIQSKRILGKYCKDGRWMKLAQDRTQWQGLLWAVLKLWILLTRLSRFFPYENWIFLSSRKHTKETFVISDRMCLSDYLLLLFIQPHVRVKAPFCLREKLSSLLLLGRGASYVSKFCHFPFKWGTVLCDISVRLEMR